MYMSFDVFKHLETTFNVSKRKNMKVSKVSVVFKTKKKFKNKKEYLYLNNIKKYF